MADPEHVEILIQGVPVWNRWRENNPNINADLQGIVFKNADLMWVNLNGVDLRWANLKGVNLSYALLINTNLSESYLNEANLSRANLNKADLSGSNLSGTILINPDTDGTILEGTTIAGTVFGNVDLSSIVGLEKVQHRGPSTISIDTVYASKGNIPESFLRGCGVPENFIQYMSSLTGQAFEYYSCFLSFSSNDQAFADRLYADLQNKGVRCWFASEDMKIGDKIRDRIDQSIRIHDKLLLILSEHSINSEWVEDEVETAYEQERQRGKTVLFPIRLDSAVMDTDKAWASKLRRSRHIGDFTQWKDHDAYQKAFDRLMRDLKAEE